MAQAVFKSSVLLKLLDSTIPFLKEKLDDIDLHSAVVFTQRAINEMRRIKMLCEMVDEVILSDLEWGNINYHHTLVKREAAKSGETTDS